MSNKSQKIMSGPHPKLILASRSPARRKLLKKLGLPFTCVTSKFKEDMTAHPNPRRLARILALGKAEFVADRLDDFARTDAVIIGADTFIMVEGNKLGKPRTRAQAREMIAAMSGKTITVLTGVAVIKTNAKALVAKKLTTCVSTKIKIKKMTATEIKFLASQADTLNISGGFSIEGAGSHVIEKVDGDIDNVIGLPLFKLREMLKKI